MWKFWSKFKSIFDLNGVSEVYFWKSEWETFDPCDKSSAVSNIFISYRLIYAIYFTLTLFFNLLWIDSVRISYWPIYLTNWSYTIQTIYSLVAFFLVVGAKWDEMQPPPWGQAQDEFIGCAHKDSLPTLAKVTWILFNMVNMIPVGVTLIYWLAVYDGEFANSFELASDYIFHVVNTVLAVGDASIVAIPVRAGHFVFGLGVLLVYLLFTILYEIAGGSYEKGTDYIYKVLDWKNDPEGAVITAILALFVFSFSHTICAWGVSKCRIYLSNKLASDYIPL